MSKLNKLRSATLACAATLLLSGCIIDSVQPWLESDSVMKPELDFEGDWEMAGGDFEDKYIVTLDKKRDSRSIDKQSYYIRIIPRNFDSRFNFIGVAHEVNDIKLFQITNITHYHDDVFSLANRPTVSLWQIAYDEDNIIVWAPSFLMEFLTENAGPRPEGIRSIPGVGQELVRKTRIDPNFT